MTRLINNMIRLFIYTFLRFLVVGIAIYLALALLRMISRLIQKRTGRKDMYVHTTTKSPPKEEYRDVVDADFTEIDDKKDK